VYLRVVSLHEAWYGRRVLVGIWAEARSGASWVVVEAAGVLPRRVLSRSRSWGRLGQRAR
jgi:hypothetical protein